MSQPIADKAEVSIDFPDKFYMGSFGRESRFEVTADKEGVHLHLHRSGEERRHVAFHLHYYLLEDMLGDMATALADAKGLEPGHLTRLADAAHRLAEACEKR
jgi:hypothetical protein